MQIFPEKLLSDFSGPCDFKYYIILIKSAFSSFRSTDLDREQIVDSELNVYQLELLQVLLCVKTAVTDKKFLFNRMLVLTFSETCIETQRWLNIMTS